MTNEQNQLVIENINVVLQKISNIYANKLVFGFINGCCDCCEGKLLYLYKRVLQERTFDSNEYLGPEYYNAIYINVQQITKKY